MLGHHARLELWGQSPWTGGPGTSRAASLPSCAVSPHHSVPQHRWVLSPTGATLWGRKGDYCACDCAVRARATGKALFRRWRKAVPYKYLLMQIKSFVFSNVHFAFSLIIFSELPYVLLAIFQSCQIKKRKPYN